MNHHYKRHFIVNFNDGTAEFHDNDTPPAVEYLSIDEHQALQRDLEFRAEKAERILREIIDSKSGCGHPKCFAHYELCVDEYCERKKCADRRNLETIEE